MRRDCYHHFVSEWDFERDARSTSFPRKKLSEKTIRRKETKVLHETSHEQCIIKSIYLLTFLI